MSKRNYRMTTALVALLVLGFPQNSPAQDATDALLCLDKSAPPCPAGEPAEGTPTPADPLVNLTLCGVVSEDVSADLEEEVSERPENSRVRLYDAEVGEALTSEEAIMDALYEEKWDLSTRNPIQRREFCEVEPNYIIHWGEIISRIENGKTALLAEGAFSFKKDGTFEFLFEKRSYVGNWQLIDDQMTLTADWMNQGAAITAPVEKVQTPVEIRYSDGITETYYEESYRIGWLRLQRYETTARGRFQDCACSN